MTTIPFGELDAIAPATRRTDALRALLGAAAVISAAAVVLLGRGEAPLPVLLPGGSDGLVVLDLSASISSDTYARIDGTLDRLAGSGGRYGLIVFSDTLSFSAACLFSSPLVTAKNTSCSRVVKRSNR